MNIPTIAISDVKILDSFRKSVPKNFKLERIKDYVNVYNNIDEPITLTEDGVLIDGYTRYLVAKELNIKTVPYIVAQSKPKNKYIVGKFKNNSKSYVWRVRKKIDVNVGDKVLVINKNKKSVVDVVSVFESNDINLIKHKPVLKVLH